MEAVRSGEWTRLWRIYIWVTQTTAPHGVGVRA